MNNKAINYKWYNFRLLTKKNELNSNMKSTNSNLLTPGSTMQKGDDLNESELKKKRNKLIH